VGKPVGALVILLLLVAGLVVGCGGGDERTTTPEITAMGEPDPAESESSSSVSGPIADLRLLGPEGQSAESREICGLLTVDELRQVMPIDEERYGEMIKIHPRPEPEESPSGVKQFGCSYVDQFEKIWISFGFAEFDESASEIVGSEERREGVRTWIPIEVAGFDGFYTPGISDLGYTAQMLVQVDDLVFALAPYNTAGAPGISEPSATEGQAPLWVQKVSEDVAKEIFQ